MGKHLHRALTAAGAILGAVILLMAGVQIFLNSRAADRLIAKITGGIIDADLEYSSLQVSPWKRFPKVSLSIDSLSITYPHERFSRFDSLGIVNPLPAAGRGEEKDTLASFDRLSVSVNVWRLLSGAVRVNDAFLDNLAVFAHSYDSTACNWDVFNLSDDPDDKDTTSSIPAISVGRLEITGRPRIVYTDQSSDIYAFVGFKDLALGGDVKFSDKGLRMRAVDLDLDSLIAFGRLPVDTVAVAVDSLHVTQKRRSNFDIDLSTRSLYMSDAFGRMEIPLDVHGGVGYRHKDDSENIRLDSLKIDVIRIPILADGRLRFAGDTIGVKMSLDVNGCRIGDVLDNYLSRFTDAFDGLRTDATLSIAAKADGYVAEGILPKVDATVSIPRSAISYSPLGLKGTLDLDASGSMTEKCRVDVDVKDVGLNCPGLDARFSANVRDLLGADPRFEVEGGVEADATTICEYLPEDLGVRAEGDLSAFVSGYVYKSDLDTFKFAKSDLKGRVASSHLDAELSGSGITAVLDGTLINLSTSNEAAVINTTTDSLRFKMGDDISARVRNMQNKALVDKVEDGGRMTPRLAAMTKDGFISLRSGATRLAVKEASASAGIQMRVAQKRRDRREFLDSLQRENPGVPRDSLFDHARARNKDMQLPEYLTEKDFRSSDIKIDVGETIKSYFNEWKPTGHVSVAKGFVSTPKFPLRTRLDSIDLTITESDARINSLKVAAGTSDVGVKATFKGVDKLIRGRGTMNLDMGVKSGYLNANELIAAFNAGKNASVDEFKGDNDLDESFVTDTLADATIDGDSMPLVVLPANLNARIDVDADSIDFAKLTITPLQTEVALQGRCLQITDTRINTNAGALELDAFYSTQSKKNISAGANIKLEKMSAERIIEMLPTVDSLMPLLRSFKGDLGCDISVITQLDTNMNLLIPTMDGVVRISGENLRIEDAGDLRRVTRLLLFKNKNIGDIDNMTVDCVIHDNKVEIYPFLLSVDRYNLALGGTQGISDQAFDYHVAVLKSPLLFRFGINLFGNFDKWKFRLCRAKFNEKSPAVTSDIEDMHINLAQGVRNIFRKGVDKALAENAASREKIRKQTEGGGTQAQDESDELSMEEMNQFDLAAFEYEMELESQDITAEIDALLEENANNIGTLQQEYLSANPVVKSASKKRK